MGKEAPAGDSNFQNGNSASGNIFTVISIRKIKKKTQKSVILFSDKSTLVIMTDLIALRGLYPGVTMKKEDIDDLIRHSEEREAVQKGLLYISGRPHSCREITLKLKVKGFSEQAIRYAVDRLISLKYLDDSQFAERYTQSRMKERPQGRSALIADLMKKGIDRETAIRTVRTYYTEEEEYTQLLHLLDTLQQSDTPPQKIFRKLYSRGFRINLIYKALEQKRLPL